jgi:hypothetical protein
MLEKLSLPILLAVLLNISSWQSANAQSYIPAGCFVTDEERSLYVTPPTCYNQGRFAVLPYNPDLGYSTEDLYNIYGFQFGFEVINSWTLFYKWQTSESNSSTHYKWYSAEFDKNKRMKSLEKKLRKACGSKCKKIATIKSLAQDTETAREQLPRDIDLPPAGTKFNDYLTRKQER